MKVGHDKLINLVIRRGWVNKVLFVILGILLLNLGREYLWVKTPGVDKSMEEQLVPLDLDIQEKDWDYYKDTFTTKKKSFELETLSLPLVLKGTVISNPSKSFAIIEDSYTGTQELYSLGDIVSGAKIIAMNRNRVIIEYSGQKHELRMAGHKEEGLKVQVVEAKPRPFLPPVFARFASSSASSFARSDLANESSKEPVVDFAKLFTQMRIKPYFQGGRCIGFQLISVGSGSLVERLGLREGDIIETVNGVRLDDPLKALQVLYSIDNNNPVHLGIERRDERLELDCRIEG